ncbi:glyoxalase/bleomycin resistance/extradiol dioxygenase family protein [Devosia sp.]|uniref:glyoxalase/bleomycin resistance/extradiol dioxygenase family protein n=1 Tax=Devosia sp. TaxID=1871048 RepID=UPI0032677544
MQQSLSLFFTTNCEAAMGFYQSCGLGEGKVMVRYGDHGMAVRSQALRGKVLHARFEGQGVLLHCSDNDDAEPMRGCAVTLEYADVAAMAEMFGRLAAGGRITVPLALQGWGKQFGMLIDAFGVQWLFSER